ncbi:MAG: hypothetical protein COA36_17595 [Desulfotalea sp.]|nr:MAG: hypothetical protein COA36_17595 [Desulfotalea sp.]
MKCVLAAPKVEWEDEYYADDICLENPGIGLLASILRLQGCHVVIRDGNLENLSLSDLMSDLEGADFLGLSLDSSTIKSVSNWLFEVKNSFPNLAIALGDYAISMAWREALEQVPEGTVICIGEGETMLSDWAASGFSEETLTDLQGVAFQRDGEIHCTDPPLEVAKLDTLPWIDRQVFERVQHANHDTLVIMASRGCPFNCHFCSRPTFNQLAGAPRWRPRDFQDLLKEVIALEQRYGIQRFFLFDDQFPGSHKQATKRIQNFENVFGQFNRKYSFRVAMRVDTIDVIGDLGISAMWRSGVERIFLGLESFSKTQLISFGKPSSNAYRNITTVDMLERNGIAVHCGFINFSPNTSHEQLITNGQGLLRSRQGAYFRHFRSQLYYGPGSRMKQADSESRDNYQSYITLAPPEMKHIHSRLEELYKDLRYIDLRMERLDFRAIRSLKLKHGSECELDSLWWLWRETKEALAKNNHLMYEMVLLGENQIPLQEFSKQQQESLKILESSINKRVNNA